MPERPTRGQLKLPEVFWVKPTLPRLAPELRAVELELAAVERGDLSARGPCCPVLLRGGKACPFGARWWVEGGLPLPQVGGEFDVFAPHVRVLVCRVHANKAERGGLLSVRLSAALVEHLQEVVRPALVQLSELQDAAERAAGRPVDCVGHPPALASWPAEAVG